MRVGCLETSNSSLSPSAPGSRSSSSTPELSSSSYTTLNSSWRICC
ncbi:hypothetical protein E2C01_091332 [Portunus trituberculatus]|uniref:Uncharacterized protein n=1 Tax=Portunus trituberculatus TaxID=210409 RepID=A0A5B7JUQ9_PORTR|nr:hypothetical protein [Portunus trituberculatus]